MAGSALHPMFAPVVPDASTRVRAGVAVAVFDEQGRVLLERRSDCGLWGLPGGRIESGESVTEAAIREVREETGLTVRIDGLVGVYSQPEVRLVTYAPGEVVQLIDVLLRATRSSGTLRRSHESEDLRFFSHADLPVDLVPPAIAPLRDAFAGAAGVLA